MIQKRQMENDFYIRLSLKFEGNETDDNLIDLYDLGQSLIGFQRFLAITTHLVLNDEVITQAPSLKNAKINALPARPGSYEVISIITGIGVAVYKIATAPKDTVLGNLVRSAYDYVIKESLGFHVDFDTTLGQQYKNLTDSSIPMLTQNRFYSVIEKSQKAIVEMHRPIFASKSASSAKILFHSKDKMLIVGEELNKETYDYIHYTNNGEYPEKFEGYISSFNVNTYSGRIYTLSQMRPIPFVLNDNLKSQEILELITDSFAENVRGAEVNRHRGLLIFNAFVRRSRSGQIKNFLVIDVS